MILVCGVLGDAMIELMCARLNDMGCEYVFLDESRVPGEFDVSWSIRGKDVTGYVSSPSGKVNLDDITGHDCIAPERRNDPGPAFPMQELRELCGFSGLPEVHRT